MVVIVNLANFLSISLNQTKFLPSVCRSQLDFSAEILAQRVPTHGVRAGGGMGHGGD
jgi:hypothetical protein